MITNTSFTTNRIGKKKPAKIKKPKSKKVNKNGQSKNS